MCLDNSMLCKFSYVSTTLLFAGKCSIFYHGYIHNLETAKEEEFLNKSDTKSKVSVNKTPMDSIYIPLEVNKMFRKLFLFHHSIRVKRLNSNSKTVFACVDLFLLWISLSYIQLSAFWPLKMACIIRFDVMRSLFLVVTC